MPPGFGLLPAPPLVGGLCASLSVQTSVPGPAGDGRGGDWAAVLPGGTRSHPQALAQRAGTRVSASSARLAPWGAGGAARMLHWWPAAAAAAARGCWAARLLYLPQPWLCAYAVPSGAPGGLSHSSLRPQAGRWRVHLWAPGPGSPPPAPLPRPRGAGRPGRAEQSGVSIPGAFAGRRFPAPLPARPPLHPRAGSRGGCRWAGTGSARNKRPRKRASASETQAGPRCRAGAAFRGDQPSGVGTGGGVSPVPGVGLCRARPAAAPGTSPWTWVVQALWIKLAPGQQVFILVTLKQRVLSSGNVQWPSPI